MYRSVGSSISGVGKRQVPALQPSTPWLLVLAIVACFIGSTFCAFRLGTYPVTLASAGCALVLLTNIRAFGEFNRRQLGSSLIAVGFVVLYPVVVYLVNLTIFNQPFAVSEWVRSYGLWVMNGLLLAGAFFLPITDRLRMLGRAVFTALVVITTFGVLQSLVANGMGSTSLYNIWGPFEYFSPTLPALKHFNGSLFRATSFFYEPSMFGRMAVSLAAACLIANFKPVTVIALSGIAVVASVSAGSILLWAIVVLLWARGFRERPAKTSSVVTLAAVLFFVALPFFTLYGFQRLSEINSMNYSSGFVRVTLPFYVVRDALTVTPFGASLGSNEYISQENLLFRYYNREAQITNGLYEMILYTGVMGILILLGLVVRTVRDVVLGDWRRALVLTLLITSTVVSSSFLAFESTVQLLPVILFFRGYQYHSAKRRAVSSNGAEFGRA